MGTARFRFSLTSTNVEGFSLACAMNDTTTNRPLATRKVFSLALVGYFLLWLAGFAFVYRVFGFFPAIGLSLILVFPLIVGIRMRGKWQSLRPREFVLLSALLVIVLAAGSGLVWNWYATGMDRRHTEDVECAAFGRLLRKDPAFRKVEIFVSGKHIFWIRGSVASKADLDRLRSLAAQYPIDWNEEVEVTSAPKQAEQVPGRSSSDAKESPK